MLNRSYTVDYAAYAVTPPTWLDGDELDLVSVGGIEFQAALRRADGTCDPPSDSCTLSLGEPIRERWVRVYALVTEDSARKVPLYTGLASLPRHVWEGPVETWETELTGPLARADEVLLPPGWWWQADPASKAGELLSQNCPAPVSVARPAANMPSPIYAESGETALTMAQKLCDACGYRIRVAPDGSVSVEPEPTSPTLSIDEGGADVMHEDVEESTDMAGVPNVYRVTTDSDAAVWRDDDPGSPYSTVSRGREIWAQEEGVSLVEGESASTRAMQALQRAQRAATTVAYTREFDEGTCAGDLAGIDMPATGIKGIYRITRMSLECGIGIDVDEEAELWEG